MKLTDEQIRATVAAMRAPETVKRALLKQALSGDPRARFSLHAIRRRKA